MKLLIHRHYKIVIPKSLLITFCILIFTTAAFSQGTRLLRQPSISETHIAFAYGGDIWVSDLETKEVVRLTSTPAIERDPHFSPDGKVIAFTSNRSGSNAIYTVSIEGGMPKRLTWHPSSSRARGWSPDGKNILYTSDRETPPTSYDRLWSISKDGGNPNLVTAQWGTDGSYSADGNNIVIDRISRWDPEWRAYRGGQNTPLTILNLSDLSETFIPNEDRSTDIQPLWMGDAIYFLSDRDWTSNIWSFTPSTGELKQLTHFEDTDIKWLSGNAKQLTFERDGYLHLLNLEDNKIDQLNIAIKADFPWAETKWEDVSRRSRSVSISPTGKRAIMEARGEIFTVPVEHGDTRNLTQSSNAADRAPIWSPKGDQIAWFSDSGNKGYALMISTQDGLKKAKSISIGISKMAWEPTWSPDGKFIAFVDDDVRIRIVDIEKETIITADVGGVNIERGSMGITWSPDSKWLSYSKTANNSFRQIKVWSLETKEVYALTNTFADAFSPSWDLDKKHLYFLASTELALASNWASTSSMTASPDYGVYIINLQKEVDSPFKAQSDEEEVKKKEKETTKDKKKPDKKKKGKEEETEEKVEKAMKIDFDGIERRTMALPLPKRPYGFTLSGPEGSLFIGERIPNSRGYTLQKFDLKERKAKEFVSGVSQVSISADAKKMLAQVNGSWKVMDASRPNGKDGKALKVNLKMKLDRMAEWKQIFEEAWRYERDYFYDPNMHGRDWDAVYKRYAPLVAHVKHRSDLTYILDQVNGELSVGHSYVYEGDVPKVDRSSIGLLGADLEIKNDHWSIKRIYTTESWNPRLTGPLDQPGMKIEEGYYIVGINGKELKASDNPFEFLDGTVGQQITLHINKEPKFENSWKEIVEPIRSENNLRQRAWVEDNRRLVDKLSNGKLAYIWVPNTASPGTLSFDRYFFAQQDKEGAIIDERFNGGGLLDDYMVDLMTRKLRAALTNEVPNGKAFRLPGGILGPKVLLINEKAGSGGDFFPWVFRQQKVGPIIGRRTWGGLVKSSIHYSLIDGGLITAPDNAVFDPINKEWVTENKGAYPDIEVHQDTKSLTKGVDPQLEKAIEVMLKLIDKQVKIDMTPPPFSTPAKKK